ncbi:hypothetical protein PVAND_013184 [Polypedilum vanderplanki]|uniref:Uncharacterized protein n=1 Tax=Polypedilum vanderplanki TaxID=319348 RepID=A0A9J6CQN6_POLVA|nr:hypothetical protein PVAND_013184 [Polypedilum vanderplanki]
MVHPNRKIVQERPDQEERQIDRRPPPLDRIVLQVPPGYKIPKISPQVRDSYNPPPSEPQDSSSSLYGHSSRQHAHSTVTRRHYDHSRSPRYHRGRSRSPRRHKHSSSPDRRREIHSSSNRHRRRSSSSPRRSRRDYSLERYRRQSTDRRKNSIRRSPSCNRRVQFAPAAKEMEVSPQRTCRSSPNRHRRLPSRSRSARRRHSSPPAVPEQPRPLSLAERLGPQIQQPPKQNRTVQERNPSVLKFENVPTDVNLCTFLTLLSRTLRSVLGATREYDYSTKTPGTAVFIYLYDQDEVDYAAMHALSFEFESGHQDIRPLLLSATITSLPIAEVDDPSSKIIPTVMIRKMIPTQIRQAIASAIDAVQIITSFEAQVTHRRGESM